MNTYYVKIKVEKTFEFDDEIEAVARAVEELHGGAMALELEQEDFEELELQPALPRWRYAP